ncbi:MAG: alpha-2-macroglobulin family protein [Planctomycetota bacterium]|nr:alpha-2-macroglobulin family protein [Planctomycetota bacterium]
MSRRIILTLAVCFVLGISLAVVAQQQKEGSWKAVNDAINKGLPKTAIASLEKIEEQALTEKKYAEAVKAIGMRVAMEGVIQGNKPAEKITRMRAEIETAPEEMRPMLEAIVANWFWNYLQQNRWRFMQRTQIAEAPGDDFTTWDLPRILAEIDREFKTVLESSVQLKQIPVSQYDILLEKGNVPDAYRPTLYDFVANNALEFYTSGEQVASRAQDAFDLSAESPIFSKAEDFIAWQPDSRDEESLTLRAILLYQELLRFHQDDEDPTAFLDVDLARLAFGYNTAFGEEKAARYQAALRRFINEHRSSPTAAIASHALAQIVYAEDDFVGARRIAQEGLTRHPDSVGGRRCYNLIQQIEAKSSRVVIERVWNEPGSPIEVHYRNVTKIYFRLVKFDFQEFVDSGRWQVEALNDQQRRQLLSQRPLREWSADLPATEDFRERVETLPAVDDLASGSYFLVASHDPAFIEKDNQVSFSEVWQSNLAVVVRKHQGRGFVDGFVLEADSGEPIADAKIESWQRDNRNRLVPRKSITTDKNGLFRISGDVRRPILLLASKDGESLSSSNQIQTYQSRADKPYQQTRFFTDRSIYRPGQMIRYKGICIAVDQKKDDYETIPRRRLTVVFRDVNGEEIERISHETNAYGSFSGSVTAPRDRLMGRMSLQIAGGPSGATQVTVEEYKRPKFKVDLESPVDAPKLMETVLVPGQASAYTGASIDGAKVRWRVVREVRYPAWWYWRCWWMPPQTESQEIAHGSTMTDALGNFQVEFEARPDFSVSEEAEPKFQFTVYADVTDGSGETRSDQRSISVGYTALAATMTAADWLTEGQPVKVQVRTTTLDGVGQSASGRVRLYEVEQPESVTRPALSGPQPYYRNTEPPKPDSSNPNSWPLGGLVQELPFETNDSGALELSVELKAGMYRAKLETVDRFGKQVTAELPIQVLDLEANQLNLKVPNLFASPTVTIEPGEEYLAVWGSGYDTARAYIEVEHRGKLLQSFWTKPGRTQQSIQQLVSGAMRGGFYVRTTMVRENRAYMESRYISVPWTNKKLALRWEHIVSKLEPGEKETWTAIVSGADAEARIAEMVATMYDASLDTFLNHSWSNGFGVFRRDNSYVQSVFENRSKTLRQIFYGWNVSQRDGSLVYRQLPVTLVQGSNRFGFARRRGRGMEMEMEMFDAMDAAPAGLLGGMGGMAPAAKSMNATLGFAESDRASAAADDGGQSSGAEKAAKLENISARKNLNETAFFFPDLVSSKDGTVRMTFTMPEALTEWKFLGFAHDNQLRSGLLTGTTVTAKDLMVQPNPPRFLREGDVIEFTVKVSNQSPTRQTGTVRLSFNDARTGDAVDEALGNVDRDRGFEIPAGESRSFAWRLHVPDGMGYLTYKAVGTSGRLSDGEEGFLPVLSRRILVTESIQLPIRGVQSKDFDFEKLLKSAGSETLQHQSLTVQMTSNPSWYAVMALPYLMEYPHECSEQTFNRLYANSLARHIAASDPKIERVFAQWRGTPALESSLEKNQDLKTVMLEETPWVREAKNESQARRNVGILFDQNRLDSETVSVLRKLTQMQLPDGAWPWFPGGRANDYITLYITTGFGRLRHLGVDIEVSSALKSLSRLDGWMTENYLRIDTADREKNHLSSTIALYLYGRSFFLEDQPVADEYREAVNFWLAQAKTYWLDLGIRQSQAHLAIALKRFGDVKAARGIMRSIKERSVSDEEMGMYWRDTELSWWWYRAPIETQAMMIEAFDEVMDDQQSVEECKVWLLKQKQTRDWKTTKATADAVYSLLLRGSNLLASNELLQVELAGKQVKADRVEAGTGFYEQIYTGDQVEPEFGKIRVTKVDQGVAWGGVHWQYFEDISKITPHKGTPLELTKQLYVRKITDRGPVLERVDGPLAVGDELVVRIVLRSDRDMEYLHLKDHRGSGTEPVNVLSTYKYQDGLAYYESTRDAASHFFIDYLPKGTYVFEYSSRVQLKGEYQSGMASIECMYAPEFNSHSESFALLVE